MFELGNPLADITASEAKYFTIIDAAKGYHQFPLRLSKSVIYYIYYAVWSF